MFVWWAIYGDDFDVTRDILLTFPIDIDSISDSDKKKLVALAEKLQESLSKKIIWQKRTFPDKRVIKVGNWDLSGSKDVLAAIDSVWTAVLGGSNLESELLFQYYASVKSVAGDEPDD
jgi:hypothetical protein